MAFIRRLLGIKDKAKPEPMRGMAERHTEAEHTATRERMEAEMDADKQRRADRAARESNPPPPGGSAPQ
jgi:hypothetical protein